jgi:hypothetical protein
LIRFKERGKTKDRSSKMAGYSLKLSSINPCHSPKPSDKLREVKKWEPADLTLL